MRLQESQAPRGWEPAGAVGQLPARAGITFTHRRSKQK